MQMILRKLVVSALVFSLFLSFPFFPYSSLLPRNISPFILSYAYAYTYLLTRPLFTPNSNMIISQCMYFIYPRS
ncbi:uncharacterized protein F4812DRAFT_271510 [Daldinia caldariorum]|uniref:uncharacterized protein n=1 Tax=Daldinia caldariorum TaxID=326644 RepID=UPI002007DEBA|nr:uncharacterized protein F4812DRAFT_271510 [Daldinia caldariorum]KAI1470590.1 hypothetical protein F4812DRAFT_271510 [Daldinia caldariorum]